MTAIEEMCQVFAHSPEEQERIEKSYVRAELQVAENLFKGRAVFEFERKGSGMFFPDRQISDSVRLHQSAILRSSAGTEIVLKGLELCLAPGPLHYHFTFEAPR